ncbi:MAG: ABC transporter substrate-binding protein [Candidatus Dormibacteraeota bacterium]|nr:ABC transporter substrate-binding protein [Candidatus Dormibacteraeota bacterium]
MTRAGWRDTGPRWLAAATAVLSLLMAGCGGSAAGNAAASPSSSSTASAATGTDGLTGSNVNGAVVNYLSYVGGTAGKANQSLSPVAIGWVNQQGGFPSTPQATKGAEAAVNFINDNLGGIGGHPVTLHTCYIASAEEEGQRCGQQLVADSAVQAIAFGFVATGNQSFESVLNGQKPLVIGVSAAPSDAKAKNTYIFYGDQTHILGPWGTYLKQKLHAKTAAIVYPNEAGAQTGAQATKQGIQKAGIQVKAVGFDPQATDLLGPLTAAGVQTADVFVPFPDTPQCASMAKALKEIGSKKAVVSNPLCLDPTVATALGGDLPLWTYGIATVLPSDPTAADAKTYSTVAAAAGLGSDFVNPWAEVAWGQILEIAKFMNGAGGANATSAGIASQLKSYHGPLILGAPSVQCGKYSDAPAVCNDQTKFYNYEGKGVFKPASGWLRPPG